MNASTWIWTHLSTGLVLGYFCLLATSRLPNQLRYVLAIFTALTAFIPLRGTDVTGLILAYTDILSTSTATMIIYDIVSRQRRRSPTRADSGEGMPSDSRRQIAIACVTFILAGAFLYPSALGFVSYDLFAVGYQSSLTWSVLAVSLCFAAGRCWLPAYCLVTAVIAHGFRLTDSPNLWNYLLDPWVVLAAPVQIVLLARRERASRVKPSLPLNEAATTGVEPGRDSTDSRARAA